MLIGFVILWALAVEALPSNLTEPYITATIVFLAVPARTNQMPSADNVSTSLTLLTT